MLIYHIIHALSQVRVPVLVGLENASAPTADELKAFSAAFGTTSSAALFHIAGHTPEAPDAAVATGGLFVEGSWKVRGRFVEGSPEAPPDAAVATGGRAVGAAVALDGGALARAYEALNTARAGCAVDVVALGNPHLSA